MLLKIAVKNIRRSKLMSILTVCEMTCAIVITLVMVSSVLIRFRFYTPFKDMFESKGLYCEFNSAANKDFYGGRNSENYLANDDVFAILHSPKSIAAVNLADCCAVTESGLQSVNNYSYSDEIIRRFSPQLSSGRWLNESVNADCIEAVVSHNDLGWSAGDIITVAFGEQNCDVRIVGVIEENAKLPGGFAQHSTGDDFNIFFNPYSYEIEEKPLLVFSSQYLQKRGFVQGLFSGSIITYPDSVTDEQLKADSQLLTKFGCAYCVTLAQLDKNSKLYLYRHVYDMLPIIIVILVLTFVSALSSTALTTRSRLKNYAVFCICGMRWKQGVLIEFVRSVILSAVSLALSLVTIGVLAKHFGMSIVWSVTSAVSIAAIIVMFLLVSLAAPALMIGKSTPKQILGR